MKKIVSIISVIVSFIFVFILSSCNSSVKIDEIKLSEDVLNMQIGSYEYKYIGYTIYPTSIKNVDIEWTCSDENVAIVEGSMKSDSIGTAKITPKSYGTCVITLKVGNKTKSLIVNVGIDPKISVSQQKNNIFEIYSNLPVGTKISVTLSNNDYNDTQEIVLEESTYLKSKSTVLFNDIEKELVGNFSLSINLCDISKQSEEIISLLGANYENLVGDNIEIINDNKILKFENMYELPYKTDLEKIQETDYRSLSKEQKLAIINWIEERYEYYDELYGKYSGDRYTETIFSEAAERYNKTKSEIRWVWNQSYELKYN